MGKILIITPAVGPYGGWNMFYRLIKYCRANALDFGRLSITIITAGPCDTRLKDLTNLNLKIVRTRWIDYNKNVHKLERSPFLNLFCNLPVLIMSTSYMLIRGRGLKTVITNGFLSCLPAVLYKRVTKNENVKIYPWLHTDNKLGNKGTVQRMVRFSSNWIDMVFVNSIDVKNDMINCGIPEEKITIINNWVDRLELSDDEERGMEKQYKFLDDYEYIVLYLGRFVEYKHFITYVKVAEMTARHKIAFIFIGSGESYSILRKASSNNRHIYFYSNLHDKHVRYLLSRANITLTYADESYLGLSAYESLCSGTPIIYVDVSCAQDKYFIKTRITEDLVPPDIGFKISDKVEEISDLVVHLKNIGYPSDPDREKCKNYAETFHSEKNAELLSSYVFRY